MIDLFPFHGVKVSTTYNIKMKPPEVFEISKEKKILESGFSLERELISYRLELFNMSNCISLKIFGFIASIDIPIRIRGAITKVVFLNWIAGSIRQG